MSIVKQTVFIIGAPRSGTTWLQAMLGAHPAICTTAELMLFNHYTAQWVDAWNAQVRLHHDGSFVGLPTLWSEEEFYGFLKEFLDRVYSRVREQKPEAPILLDKHPGYAQYVDHIDRLIPTAKFIHIIRDGRDVASSMMAAAKGWARIWAPQSVEKAAASWKTHTVAARQAARHEGRYLEMRYEDLLASGVPVMRKVYDFLGVPMSEEQIAATLQEHQFEKMKKKKTGASQFTLPEGFFRQGGKGDWQATLNPTQRIIFHEVAGDLLCELGYATDSWWVQHEYQRVMLPATAFLLNPTRSRKKMKATLKHLVGPTWLDRIRNIRGALQPKNGKELPENG
ncbi:MAG: sulfotransferase [Candidatus Binatia bacterium]